MIEQDSAWQPFKTCFVYDIYLPRDTSWSPEQALQLMRGVLVSFPHCALRLAANSQRIAWQFIDWNHSYSEQQIVLTIRSVYPSAVVKKNQFQIENRAYPLYRTVAIFRLSTSPILPNSPLQFVTDFRHHDSLMALTQAMNTLLPGEEMHLTVVCGVSQDRTNIQLIGRVGQLFAESQAAQDLEVKARRAIDEKVRAPQYAVLVTLQVESPVKDRIHALENLVQPILTQGFSRLSPASSLRRDRTLSGHEIDTITSMEDDLDTGTFGLYNKYLGDRNTHSALPLITLIAEEMAALWHLPHENMAASRIYWMEPIKGELPELLVGKQEGVCFGNGIYREQAVPVYIPDRNRRTHMSVLGGAGAGKSTFLHNLIHQDIAEGKGLAVIDPHGTLVEAILEQSVPLEREQDVVVIDLSQHDYPPPLNPFRGGGELGNAGKILRAVEMASGTGNYARLKKFLQAAVQTVVVDPDATMRDLSRIFRDDAYRNDLLTKVDNPILDETWGDYDDYNLSIREGVRDPVLSRINPFYGNQTLYRMFCHPHGLDFAEYIRTRKIILVSLNIDSRSMSKDEEEMIGALLIAQLQMAGMEQEVDSSLAPFYIYIDEVERFVTDSLDTILSEARKRGLSLILAHQFLYQIRGNLLKSVMANVDTRVVFRCSLEDAKEFTPYMGGQFTDEDVITLSNHRAIVKTQYTQYPGASPVSLAGFGIKTLEPVPVPSDAKRRAARIRESSIKNYTPLSANAVKEWLDTRYPRKRSLPSAENEFFEP